MPGGGSTTADMRFLEDQVVRLSEALARSQGRTEDGSSSAASLAGAAGEPTPSWLLDAEVMPPLLASYDARIAELERAEAKGRERVEAAERQALAERESADRMRAELRSALESSVRQELHGTHGGSSGAGARGGGGASAVALAELSQRLEVLYQENEVLTEQSRETAEELERMREEKLAQARDHMSLVKKCAALRDELSGGEARARTAAHRHGPVRVESSYTPPQPPDSASCRRRPCAVAPERRPVGAAAAARLELRGSPPSTARRGRARQARRQHYPWPLSTWRSRATPRGSRTAGRGTGRRDGTQWRRRRAAQRDTAADRRCRRGRRKR